MEIKSKEQIEEVYDVGESDYLLIRAADRGNHDFKIIGKINGVSREYTERTVPASLDRFGLDKVGDIVRGWLQEMQ